MKVGIIGGLLFGGLVAGALLGLLPGVILIGLGIAASCAAAIQEKQAAKRAESWRRNYPSYKY